MKNMKAMVCPKNIKINSKVSHVINPDKQRERERERAGKICHVPMLIHKQTNDPWVISQGQIETLLYIGGHALIQKIFWGWEGNPIENCVFQEKGGIFSIILLFEFKKFNFPGGTLSLDTPSLDSCMVGNVVYELYVFKFP